MATQYYCKKCNKTKRAEEFYGSHNLEKYPEGKLDICKDDLTMHVDNWNPETYLWILEECDVPYVPKEWMSALEKYGKDPSSVTGKTIIGRYLSKMKLKQYKDYRWKDTEFLQELEDAKLESTMKRQGYDIQEITVAKEQSRIITPPEGYYEHQVKVQEPAEIEDYFAEQAGGSPEELDLTDEDRTYLRLKWGKAYKPEEWVRLEQLYEEMMNSYDIQGAGHIDNLKLLCKTSLKANQLIDMGDIEGFQKMQKAYDSLMKSGKFTAAQNKAESGEFVDSVGELIEMCEKQGYIERFYIEQPNDRVDLTIQDMQRYTRTLIEEETNLSNLIEVALRQNAKEDAEASENDEDDIVDENTLVSIDEIEKTLKDSDFADFGEFLEEESELDLTRFLEDD